MSGPDESRLFPEAECVAATGELNAWTSVQTILAAARHIENRPTAQDSLEPALVIPIDDPTGMLERILLLTIRWLIAGYRVPEPKIALARSLDPEISEATAAALAALRFKPDIDRASPGRMTAIHSVSGGETRLPADNAVLVVRDDPAMIEMIQVPLICMIGILRRSNDLAKKMRLLQEEAEETTGGKPTIYHRHHADSRLGALLEAVCFYGWGLDLGPAWGSPEHANIDVSYRAVNVQGVPPINGLVLDIARKSMVTMLDTLH